MHRRRHYNSESDETNLTTAIVVDEISNDIKVEQQNQSEQDNEDDKYTKSWNFRNISNRIQISSGNAIRSWIPSVVNFDPSSVTAAVKTAVIGIPENNIENNTKTNSFKPNSGNNSIGYEEEEEEFDKSSVFVMASRDRTGEFGNAIRLLQSRNISRAVNIKDAKKAKQIQSYSEFMMVAKYVGKNIASTYAKLEKLTLLAKRKSLFDDRPQEIQELTYIIKGDLNALNQQIAKLQDISKDQRRSLHGKHLLSHSSNMVLALQSRLASMSTDFKQVLEVRTENLKQQKNRRDQFVQNTAPIRQIVSPQVTKHGGSLLMADEENHQISIDMSNDETKALIPLQQQQQMLLYDETDNYIQQRNETVQNIESTIVELGGIFQQLAHMVKEQEEIVERIDTNVMDVELNIEAAHSEILKYFQNVSKNRWLMIKIFGVLIFFFVFFVAFMS